MRADTFLLLRRSGLVRRLHTVPVVRGQTVGEHVYGSLIIAEYLFHKNPEMAYDTKMMIFRTLLYHDAAEVETGDVPAPAKRRYPGLHMQLLAAEMLFDSRHGLEVGLSARDMLFVKACDLLDLGFTCVLEASLGNRTREINEVYFNVLDYLKDCLEVPGVVELMDELRRCWKEANL